MDSHGHAHGADEGWVEEIAAHCTDFVQVAFITACLSIFVGGLVFIILFRIIEAMLTFLLFLMLRPFQIKSIKVPILDRWKGYFQDWVVRMLSAQTSVGRVVVILVFLFSIGSLIIYFINCYSVSEFCLSFEDQTINVDLFFNVFFLLYFGLRFLAANDKLIFWLELNSIVDFFTITPVCISFYLGRNWLGLRFLRALRLMELPKILQFLHITTSGTAIKLTKLLAVFVSTWLTAAGFLHWMENSGDPWVKVKNSQNLTYFECLYLIMVTMSTVGYGDVIVKTTLGRGFILFFIVAGLILFANLVPEMADIVGSTKMYRGSYEAVKGRKFIVVCGHVTLSSVTAFIKDFLAQASGDEATEMVFLGENAPSLELETVFRCYAAYSSFYQGTVMKTQDLLRVQMNRAEACLILADTCSVEPYNEDTSNIMRVLSIKNHYPATRVIIQIIQSSNKLYLPKLPNWDWKKGDSVICFAELKLGLIAQSCLIPGLTSLLTSLFIREGIEQDEFNIKHQNEIEGQEYKVMTQLFSSDFNDMSFKDACRLCFVKLNLILLAIEYQSGARANSILINPPSSTKIDPNTMGFFMAKSVKELKRVRHYCKQCHNHIMNPELIDKCRCKGRKGFSLAGGVRGVAKDHLKTQDEYYYSKRQGDISSSSLVWEEKPPEMLDELHSGTTLDSTGMFHWCEAVSFAKSVFKRKKKMIMNLHDHIVVCVFGDATSSLIGLRNFVMPLRASNFLVKELKEIIFLGTLEYLQREWEYIHNFPKLYVLKGSALSCADLRAANIKQCAMCVILSAHAKGGVGDQTLVDTKSILATLNIRSLQLKLNPVTRKKEAPAPEPMPTVTRIPFKRIPVITELKVASNAQFFEQRGGRGSEYQTYVSLASRGTIFSDSFLDSLLCTTYHNHHVLALLQTLVTGGTSPELEEYLAEETTLSSSATTVVPPELRNRCKLALLPLTISGNLPDGAMIYFGDVFTKSLHKLGILCFAIYRLKGEPNPFDLRKHIMAWQCLEQTFVERLAIIQPPIDLEMSGSDQLFCLVPFNVVATDLTIVLKNIKPAKQKERALSKEVEVVVGLECCGCYLEERKQENSSPPLLQKRHRAVQPIGSPKAFPRYPALHLYLGTGLKYCTDS
ncbi:potassium channel subfamily U member 1 [Anolis sagrei]|uniref:potassium channel subfamily U member 1 n=1 Tax=Anolis sagrei TaxID=38937 RepID=UPI003520CFE0